jgi:hypothetical protein
MTPKQKKKTHSTCEWLVDSTLSRARGEKTAHTRKAQLTRIGGAPQCRPKLVGQQEGAVSQVSSQSGLHTLARQSALVKQRASVANKPVQPTARIITASFILLSLLLQSSIYLLSHSPHIFGDAHIPNNRHYHPRRGGSRYR